MNDFDFFVVVATSTSKRKLESVVGYKLPTLFPKKEKNGQFFKLVYHYSLKFFEVHKCGHAEVRMKANEYLDTLPKIDGVRYQVKFYCVD
jgi:hypothetical protein